MKNKKNPSALNDYINYSGKQHQRSSAHKRWLASSKEWPPAASPGGLGSAGMELLRQKCQSARTPRGFQPSCKVVGVWASRFLR